MNLPLFLSRRLYGSDDGRRQVSRPAVRIATAGVAIGIAVMLLSVSVVVGFKRTIREKVVAFGGSIQVQHYMTLHAATYYPILIGDSLLRRLNAIEGVCRAERYCLAQGILKTDDDFLGITLKGVGEEWDSTFLHNNLREGYIPSFSADSSSNKIVVSQAIADKLRLHTEQRVYAYFFDGEGVRTRRFTIAGIYCTNLSQYDDVFCFTDLRTAVRLNGWRGEQVLGAELSVDNFDDLDAIEDRVAAVVDRTYDDEGAPFVSSTIREVNPQVFAWLDLLDMNVWVILLLMMLVAGVTIASGLLIIILERTAMIGTLKALGARNSTIQRTFLWFGIFVTGRGMLVGDAVAFCLLVVQRVFGVFRLDPQTYYVSTVPVDFNIPLFLLVNIAVLLVGTLVLLLPSMLISHIKPVTAMRFE